MISGLTKKFTVDSDEEFNRLLKEHEQTIDEQEKQKEERKAARRAAQIAKRAKVTKHRERVTVHNDSCEICQEGGDMICCETCPKAYHLSCSVVNELPEGDWFCRTCEKEGRDKSDEPVEGKYSNTISKVKTCVF